MAIYRGEFAVTRKNDDSPLTQADLAAHRHILAALHALTPAIQVLSEEAADIPYPTRSRWSSRSEEHKSELQSLMSISYAVFCLKKKKNTINTTDCPHTEYITILNT